MKYTKRMFEVTILDSYRNYGCGRGRNMNPRGTNGGYPYSGSSRCVMPGDAMCRKPVMPDCGCGDKNEHMRHMPVGIGYVPMQKWEEMYDPATALCQGTAFPSLNLIFCGKRG